MPKNQKTRDVEEILDGNEDLQAKNPDPLVMP